LDGAFATGLLLVTFLGVLLAGGFGAKRSCKKSSKPACAGKLAPLPIAKAKAIARARKYGVRALRH
jgi:hypothetical protein